MPPEPNRIRKPVATVRRRATTVRARRGWQVPPALIAALLFAALGAGAWWLMRPPPASPEPVPVVVAEPVSPVVPAAPAKEAAPVVAVAPVAAAAPEMPDRPAEPAPAPAVEPEPVSFDRLLVFDPIGASKTENATWHGEALALAKKSGQWDDYRDLLGRSLHAFAAKDVDSATVVTGAHAGPALIRHAFLTAVPGSLLTPLLKDDGIRPFMEWLLDTPEAMQAFAIALSPKDDTAKALGIWAALAAENPSARTDYRELAIACALVFDRTIKVDHDRYGAKIDPLERFSAFRENSEAGRLTGKIKQMTAADLVWVVGVPVAPKELEWAVKKADFRRKSWGQAYGSIKYDMEKAVTGKSPYDEYTFAEIQKKGGICGDQAYFSAWTACAHGIPAAIIGGDGARGPHAWMTWQADEGEWKFSGRFNGYPAGKTRNPQTGESISEEEFLRLSDKKASSPSLVLKARQALWLASVYANTPDRAAFFIAEAVKAAPRLTDPSAALLTHWMNHRSTAPVEEWTTLLRDLRKDFRDAAALMATANEAEEKFVFTRRDSTTVMKDLRREARKVGDTAGPDAGMAADLGRLTTGLRRQADIFQTNQDAEGIRSLYRRALADHGDDAATFKALTKDYFSYCQADPALAAKVCRELESACRRSIGRGKGDWFDVTSQNSAWRAVAACYKAAGDTGKADVILRDCEAREKTAKKKAI